MDFKSEERKIYNSTYRGRTILLALSWVGIVFATIGVIIFAAICVIAETTGEVHSETFPVILGLAMVGAVPLLILGIIHCKGLFGAIIQFAAPLAILGWVVLGLAFTFGLAIAGTLGPIFLIIDTVKWFKMEPLV